eukprot:508742-Rhodomonas_salina.1
MHTPPPKRAGRCDETETWGLVQVQELAKAHSDVAFLKIDVDECQEVAASNGIESPPRRPASHLSAFPIAPHPPPP